MNTDRFPVRDQDLETDLHGLDLDASARAADERYDERRQRQKENALWAIPSTASVPVSELLELAETWKRHSSTLGPGHSAVALESCAMDLCRLADSWHRSPNVEATNL